MSETVHYKGKLVKVVFYRGETMIDRMIDLLDLECKVSCNSYHIDWSNDDEIKETFLEAFCDEYILAKGELYEITEKKEICPYDDLFKAKEIEDGVFEYEVKYYSGGCGFSEAIDTAMEDK